MTTLKDDTFREIQELVSAYVNIGDPKFAPQVLSDIEDVLIKYDQDLKK